MGFHPIEIVVIAVIVLALLGPKALQSIARDAGKGMNQAKNMKDKVLAELPMEEISKVSSQIPRILRIRMMWCRFDEARNPGKETGS